MSLYFVYLISSIVAVCFLVIGISVDFLFNGDYAVFNYLKNNEFGQVIYIISIVIPTVFLHYIENRYIWRPFVGADRDVYGITFGLCVGLLCAWYDW